MNDLSVYLWDFLHLRVWQEEYTVINNFIRNKKINKSIIKLNNFIGNT